MFVPMPCPLCGKTELKTWHTVFPPSLRRYNIACTNCGWGGREAITKLGAVWKWNHNKERKQLA